MLNAKLLLLFQFLYILQLSAKLKMKASLLEKEAWGCFVAFPSGLQTSSLWDILEDLFDKISEVEEEEGPPSKKIYLEDEPSMSSDPLDPKLSTTPSPKIEITFPITKGFLHDYG